MLTDPWFPATLTALGTFGVGALLRASLTDPRRRGDEGAPDDEPESTPANIRGRRELGWDD